MTRSKKKRSGLSAKNKPLCDAPSPPEAVRAKEEQRVVKILSEAFASLSVEDASSAYREADGDADKAAQILANIVAQEDRSTACSSSSGNNNAVSSSSSNASDIGGDVNDVLPQDGYERRGGRKAKKVIATAGSVSTLLPKDYARSVGKQSRSKVKGVRGENWRREDAEQFLCSMLGNESELSLAVVSDVLCQCGYNVEKALDVLIELSDPSNNTAADISEPIINKNAKYVHGSADSLSERASHSPSYSSEVENQDSQLFWGSMHSGPHNPTKTGKLESEIPQKVLASLFNVPTPSTAEHEPKTMNWRKVFNKMASLGQKLEPDSGGETNLNFDKGDEYHVLRESAQQHWDSMKTYYQKAATAFSKGEREYAAYLSEQGRVQRNMARKADEKASKDIFVVRNQTIENMITMDLHGQHVKQAIRLLKIHLLFGAYARSVRTFRVITGCGVGKSKLKSSVIALLQREGITWSEENRGTLLVRLNGQTHFSFLDSASDSD